MKRKLYYFTVLSVMFVFSACGNGGQKETGNEVTTESVFETEIMEEAVLNTDATELQETTGLDFSIDRNTYVMDNFTGLETTVNIAAGNLGENLSAAGYVCDTEVGVFYAAENGIAWEKERGTERIYDQKASYLNYYEGKLYFIDENDREIHVLTLETGETDRILEDIKVYFLCKTELGIYYVNQKNELCLLDEEQNITVIDEYAPGWMNFYGEWLIFAESANQSCLVAVNCLTGEKKQLLSHAMFPCIAGDKLYYSGCENDANSFIGELNLATGENRSLGGYWSGSKVVLNDILYFIYGDRIYGLNLDDPVSAEEVYADKASDLLSVSQGNLYFLGEGKIMYLVGGEAYEYEKD